MVPNEPSRLFGKGLNSGITEASAGPDTISYLMGKEGPDVYSLLGMIKNQYIQQHRRHPYTHTYTQIHTNKNTQTHTDTDINTGT